MAFGILTSTDIHMDISKDSSTRTRVRYIDTTYSYLYLTTFPEYSSNYRLLAMALERIAKITLEEIFGCCVTLQQYYHNLELIF